MNPESTKYPKPLPEPVAKTLRLMWAKIQHPEGCWNWTGSLFDTGYPMNVTVDGSRAEGLTYRPQRLMFHWFKYPIPDGFTVDHLCKNRKCVNPDHMEAVSHEENVIRAVKKPYCKRGHKQTEENRYTAIVHGKPRRRCKLCLGARLVELRAERRARGLKKPGRKPKTVSTTD